MKITALAAIAAIGAGLALPASAATFYTVYRGTVTSGQDPSASFGPSPLAGSAFHAIFKVTDELPSQHLFGTYSESLHGGPGTCGTPGGCANPILEASLTINGRTVGFPAGPGSYGTVETANLIGVPGGDYASLVSYSQQLIPGLNASLLFAAYTLDAPIRFEPYAGVQAAYLPPTGIASWIETVAGVETTRFDLSLATERVYITDDPLAVVPEPATWALLILGFGAAGAALRHRRCVAA